MCKNVILLKMYFALSKFLMSFLDIIIWSSISIYKEFDLFFALVRKGVNILSLMSSMTGGAGG